MYRNLILLSFVFCAPLLLLGQSKLSKDFKVTTGEPYKVIDAGNKQYFALENSKTIAIKTRGEEVTLQRFDTKSIQTKTQKNNTKNKNNQNKTLQHWLEI